MTFSEQYKNYKKETLNNHVKSFLNLNSISNDKRSYYDYNLIDLGCGLDGSPIALKINKRVKFIRHCRYIGIDKEDNKKLKHFIKKDYIKEDWVDDVKKMILYNNTILFSTFSLDVYPTKEERQNLFNKFINLNIKYIVTSGFFYEGNDNEYINELGVTVRQSLNTYDVVPHYKQKGCVVTHCPSKMFGDNVYNVWRLYEKFM